MELHDLKLLLQSYLSDGLVTVVGSGLSCAEGLPGMTELATHLLDVIGADLAPTDADAWQILSPLIRQKGLEAALLDSAPTTGLEVAISAHTAEFIRRREQEVIAQVFRRTRKLRFTRLLNYMLKPSSGVPIITTNYDRLIEIAAEEAGLGVDTMFAGHFAGSLDEKASRLSFCNAVVLQNKRPVLQYRSRIKVF